MWKWLKDLIARIFGGGKKRGPESAVPTDGAKRPWKRANATMFWVGELSGPDNGGISNVMSAWDNQWEKHFGGYDDPDRREGFSPADFTPLENPFYCALPYNDLDEDGARKASAALVPWYATAKGQKSVLKNRWVAISCNKKVAYAQWQDVGPFEENDFDFVFGKAAKPAHASGVGIDLSPAVCDYLDILGADKVLFRFIDESKVPDGPWKAVVTTRGVSW